MRNIFFTILFAILLIGFYSCTEEETSPLNVANKKVVSEAEATIQKIIDFREKLLTNDFKVGESLNTDEAVKLMMASLNISYAKSTNGKNITELSTTIDVDFGQKTTTYGSISDTYQDVLDFIRVHYMKEGNNKSFASVYLSFNESNKTLEISSWVASTTSNLVYEMVSSATAEIENTINEQYDPINYVYFGDNQITKLPEIPIGTDITELISGEQYLLYNHLYVIRYDVPVGTKNVMATSDEPMLFDGYYYAQNVGVPEFNLLINEEQVNYPWGPTYLDFKMCATSPLIEPEMAWLDVYLQKATLSYAKKFPKDGQYYDYGEIQPHDVMTDIPF